MKTTKKLGKVIPFPAKKEETMTIFESASKLREESLARYFELYKQGLISADDLAFIINE